MKNSERIKNGKHIFCATSFHRSNGGVTRVLLKRAAMFATMSSVTLLNGSFSRVFKEHRKHFIENGFDLEPIEFIDIRKFLEEYCTDKACFFQEKVSRENIIVRGNQLYKNGYLHGFKRHHDSGDLDFIEYYDSNGITLKKDHYVDNQKIMSTSVINTQGNEEWYKEYYYTPTGFCYMSFKFTKQGNKFVDTEVLLFHQKNNKIQEFQSINLLREFFFVKAIEMLTKGIKEECFIYFDKTANYHSRFEQMEDRLIKIGTLHNPYLSRPASLQRPVPCNVGLNKFVNKNYFQDTYSADGIIFLTEEQIEDYTKLFGTRTSYYHIPNTIPVESEYIRRERNKNIAVTIARLSDQKKIDESIRAFSYVVKKIPDAQFHIYGKGEEEEFYKKTIKDLKLEKNVFLKGFTDRATEILMTSSCALFSSYFEGFCLSLFEALAVGCPAITYDFKYGPLDVIRDGENGYLIPYGDTEVFAEKIIYHFEHPETWESMSKAAYTSVLPYREEEHYLRWMEALDTMLERKPYKVKIDKMSFELKSIVEVVKRDTSTEYTVEGLLHFKGKVPECARDLVTVYFRVYNEAKTDYEKALCQIKLIENTFTISSEVKSIDVPISICLEWQNCFKEIDVGTIFSH